MDQFKKWLNSVCFQKPTPEAYDLAKDAWEAALISKKADGAEVPCNVGLGREPLRIECGQGKVGVYDGDVDGLPCLTLGNDGTGVIGEPTGRELPSAIPKEVELVTVTFANIESADVFIRALLRIKERL